MVGPLKDNDGLVITKGKEMADALNIYFCSVFTLEDKNNLPVHEPLLADNVECLTNMLITPAMIVTKIKKLKDNKSPGIDGITPQLLKGNRNNKTFLQRLRCILCVITLHSIISYYKMRFYTRKTELEASTCKFPRNRRS